MYLCTRKYIVYKMKKYILLLLAICIHYRVSAQIEVTPEDSALVVQILRKAQTDRDGEPRMVYFGRQFLGIPYVAHTLENGDREHLIVNLHGLDCTTFVETVAALSLCDAHGQRTFADYCRWLTALRYRDGKITDYTSRLHYFTWWGEDNEALGIVKSVSNPEVFTALQTVNIDYMSKHPNLYKHLRSNSSFVKKIAALETATKGRQYKYIPKNLVGQPQSSALGVIRDGDIISMLTSKPGLDTQHIGIAFWRNGRLHLMHASSLFKKVVMDTQTFYDYQQKQTSQTGIRVYRVQGL